LRLIDSGTCSAAFNMAVDESLFSSFDPSRDCPVLRLYCWERPCVSLGYFQRANDAVKKASCEEHGVDIVRRITGGRAVLHDQEVTYCVVAPTKTGPFGGRLLECYRAIAACLSAGCELLGVPGDEIEVVTGQDVRAGSASSACFMTASAYELLVGGRKLIGSAQKRRDEALVQHGSIPLRVDIPLTLSVMRVDEGSGSADVASAAANALADKRATMAKSATTSGEALRPACLEEVVGRDLTFDEVKSAIGEGFAKCLGTTLERSNLTKGERALADTLSREKYGNDSWNFKR